MEPPDVVQVAVKCPLRIAPQTYHGRSWKLLLLTRVREPPLRYLPVVRSSRNEMRYESPLWLVRRGFGALSFREVPLTLCVIGHSPQDGSGSEQEKV